MNEHPVLPAVSGTQPSVKAILREAVLVVCAGLVFAFAANLLSPRGLALGRNYFPEVTRGAKLAVALPARQEPPQRASAAAADDRVSERLRARGLQVIDSHQVVALFRDPRYRQELLVFIDARQDGPYQEGHIPDAYQFDHYHPEKYLPTVLPVCQTAEQIVVYCQGGDCEDSEFAAATLSELGIPAARLLVYRGGLAEWSSKGLPLEAGQRKSGELRNTGRAARVDQ